jgi:hypothetical protein
MMNPTKIFRYGLAGIALGISVGSVGFVTTTQAQEPAVTKPVVTKRVPASGRDPFKRIEPFRFSAKRAAVTLGTPSIEERIAQYKAQKVAAMNARMVAPKPTTALLLNELEIVGISRTPRGYAAIVEATPIKLSYVIYPGERFYDGQLVAIEDSRLVFRREMVLSDGKRTRSVEIKNLRQAGAINAMSATKTAPTGVPVAEAEKTAADPAAAPKPE